MGLSRIGQGSFTVTFHHPMILIWQLSFKEISQLLARYIPPSAHLLFSILLWKSSPYWRVNFSHSLQLWFAVFRVTSLVWPCVEPTRGSCLRGLSKPGSVGHFNFIYRERSSWTKWRRLTVIKTHETKTEKGKFLTISLDVICLQFAWVGGLPSC